jgi:hypothetical protein
LRDHGQYGVEAQFLYTYSKFRQFQVKVDEKIAPLAK